MKYAIKTLDNELTNVLFEIHHCTELLKNPQLKTPRRLDLLHRMALAEDRKRDILKALDVLNNL